MRWRRRVLLGTLVVAVLVVGYLGVTFVQVWRAAGNDSAVNAGAIVVLGAAQYNGDPSPALEARLARGLELWEADRAPLIVVTGGRQPGDTFTEATSGYRWLRDRGVPDAVIRKEVKGTSTYESLRATARFLTDEGVSEVLLVTSPWHAERTAATAEEVGLEDHVVSAEGSSSLVNLARETAAVSAGRVIGFRRLERFDP